MTATDDESDATPPAPDALSPSSTKPVFDRRFALASTMRVGEAARALDSLTQARDLLPSVQIEKLLRPSPAQLAMTEAFRLPSVVDEVMRHQQDALRAIQMPSVGSAMAQVLADQERQQREMLRPPDPTADIGRWPRRFSGRSNT